MNNLLLTYTLLFFNSAILCGQAKKIEFMEYDLSNGLHVILHQDNTAPIVAVSVLYHVGSKNEDPKRTGFAHFFEHLLFEGSKNIKRGEFDKYVSQAGGFSNAYTTADQTFYYETLPSNQLEMGLWLESERMMHAKINSVGVEIQREVVQDEKRQSVDNRPYGSLFSEVQKRAYTVHPYRWTTIGSLDHLNKATLEEFMEFYRTFYTPENATLSIAGDIDIADTKKAVEKYFKDIKRGGKPIPRPTVVEPPQTKEIRAIIYDNIELPAVVQAYHMPAQGTRDAYALSLLSMVLSGAKSSRMYTTIVDEQQKALSVYALPLFSEQPGLYFILGICNIGTTAADLEKAMDVEIEKVKKELIPERELQKVKNQLESDFIQKSASVLGIAEQLAMYHVGYGDTDIINTAINQSMKVTREDLQRVARQYLTKENRVLLYYLPKYAEKGKPTDKPVSN